MKRRIEAPRLLPTTIFALAGLLAVKSVDLVRAAVPGETVSPASPAAHQSRPEAKPPPVPAATAAPPAPAPPVKADQAPPGEGERALLLELRQRRRELEARDAALSAREAVLEAAERKLSSRVDELKALQARLETLDAARKAHEEENWRGLVKLYENMRPRDAAVIFNELDMPVLLQVLDRMKEAKAAPVLAAMQPEKARQVTADLAQLRTKATSDGGSSRGG